MQNNSGRKRDGFLGESKSLGSMLPSPAILESYEEVRPGTVDDLVAMVKKEQKHRHAYENKMLQAQIYTKRFGQLLAFTLAIIIIYSAISFASDAMYYMAAAVLVCGFGFLSFVHFIPKLLFRKREEAQKKREEDSKKRKNYHHKSNRTNNQNRSTGQSQSRRKARL